MNNLFKFQEILFKLVMKLWSFATYLLTLELSRSAQTHNPLIERKLPSLLRANFIRPKWNKPFRRCSSEITTVRYLVFHRKQSDSDGLSHPAVSGARRRDPKSPHSSRFITFAPLLGISSPFYINAGSLLPSSAWCISKQFSFCHWHDLCLQPCLACDEVIHSLFFKALSLIKNVCLRWLTCLFESGSTRGKFINIVLDMLYCVSWRWEEPMWVETQQAGGQAYLSHTENHRGEWSDCNKPSLWRRRCMHKKPCPGLDKGGWSLMETACWVDVS